MSAYLLAMAAVVLVVVAVGLARLLAGPTAADRLMAAQLLGSGGVAALLLLGAGTGDDGVLDLALLLVLLAAFAGVAFVLGATRASADTTPEQPPETGPGAP